MVLGLVRNCDDLKYIMPLCRVFNYLSNVKLLDNDGTGYEKFSTIFSASSLGVILASWVPWLVMTVFFTWVLRPKTKLVLEKRSMIDCRFSSEREQKVASFAEM